MDKSEGKCFCGIRGHQIHHIDGDKNNNDFDNLAFLCFDHHDDATIALSKGPRLKKRLTPKQIKNARDKHYREIERKKEVELKHYKSTLKTVSEESFYRASLDANIITELIKIKDLCFESRDWKKREEAVEKLRMYSDYASLRVSKEVISFMYHLSGVKKKDSFSNNSLFSVFLNENLRYTVVF